MYKAMILAGAALVLAAPTMAQQAPAMLNTMAMAPDFLKTAATSDEFERESGKLAAEKAMNPQVKSFGQMMVQMHTQSTKELAQAAEAAGQQAPAPKLHPGQEKKLKMLRDAPAAMFDKMYLQQQHEAHVDALQLMKAYAAQGKEPPLRAAAAKTAPVVQQHLTQVVNMQRSMR